MKKQTITRIINRYDLLEGYYVEVFEEEGLKNYWLCRDGYGEKVYMFGSFDLDENEEEIIEANAADYVETCKEYFID